MGKQDDNTLAEFAAFLKAQGKAPPTVRRYRSISRQFLRHIGNEPLDRISEELTRDFFSRFSNRQSRYDYVNAVHKFLQFAVARMPARIEQRLPEPEPVKTEPVKTELALRETWALDKQAEQKAANDDLVARLARKVIDHYLYFQGRLTGGPDNLDDVCRFADECRELIQSNLPLFMKLSKEGRNIHSIIDERMQK